MKYHRYTYQERLLNDPTSILLEKFHNFIRQGAFYVTEYETFRDILSSCGVDKEEVETFLQILKEMKPIKWETYFPDVPSSYCL